MSLAVGTLADHYDVIIIGAGSAGLAAREEVAKGQMSYLVVDDGPLGTTCARVGCMPSKVFIEAANIYHQNYKFERLGITGAENLHVDHEILMNHVRSLRDRFVGGVVESMKEWSSEHLYQGRAKLAGPGKVEIDGKIIGAKKVILATGSTTHIPEKWRSALENKNVFTSDTFFELHKIPHRMAVIGTGPLGLELALGMARVGIECFLFGEDISLGGLTDPELLDAAKNQIEKELFLVPENVTGLKPVGKQIDIITNQKEYKVQGVLLAMGRKPNLHNIGLETLGVNLDKKGVPAFCKQSMRIDGTDVYLAGDISASLPVLHEAVDEGRIAGYNSVQKKDHKFRRRTGLAITFSSPQIAVVGKSYKKLKVEQVPFEVGKVSFENQGRALTKLENAGMVKIFGDPEDGTLLGAELFAPEAEHLAHTLAWAIETKATAFDLLSRPYYHPTLEEGLRTALRNLSRRVKNPRADFELSRCQDAILGMEK